MILFREGRYLATHFLVHDCAQYMLGVLRDPTTKAGLLKELGSYALWRATELLGSIPVQWS